MADRALARRALLRTYAPQSILNRELIEARCEALADQMHELIALLDDLDGDPDLEDGGDTESNIGGMVRHSPDGTALDECELDPAESGIADFDALQSEEFCFSGLHFDGSGTDMARQMLADRDVRGARKFAVATNSQ